MRHVLVEHRQFFGVVARTHSSLTQHRDERLVLAEDLLHLHRVVRHQFGGGVDGGEATANDYRREPHLQVRQRVALERAGQLQRHQEVAGLADAANEVVLDVDDRRPASARRNRHMVEPVLPRIVYGQRAAEADAAVDPDPAPAR